MNPREALGEYASQQARAVQDVREEAKQLVAGYLRSTGREPLLSFRGTSLTLPVARHP